MSKKKTAKTTQKPAAKKESNDLLEQNNDDKPAAVHTPSGGGSYGSIGVLLRQRRQEQDKSLHDVASAINIRVSQLQALEDENLAALPGMTYALGFLRSYADHLGMDGNEIVARFKESHQKEISEKPELHFPVPASETLIPGSKVVWVSLLALALLVGLTGFIYEKGSDLANQMVSEPPAGFAEDTVVTDDTGFVPPSAEGAVMDVPTAGSALQDVPLAESAATMPPMPAEGTDVTLADAEVPSAPEVETATPAPTAETPVVTPAPEAVTPTATTPTAPAAPAAAPAPAAQTPVATPAPVAAEDKKLGAPRKDQGRVILKASQNSWVQISDAKGKVILRKVLRPGDTYVVPDQPRLSMVTTNAGGLEIVVDGKAIRSLGKPGDIIRGIDLDPADLKKR